MSAKSPDSRKTRAARGGAVREGASPAVPITQALTPAVAAPAAADAKPARRVVGRVPAAPAVMPPAFAPATASPAEAIAPAIIAAHDAGPTPVVTTEAPSTAAIEAAPVVADNRPAAAEPAEAGASVAETVAAPAVSTIVPPIPVPAAAPVLPVIRPALKLIANPFFQESPMATAFENTQETVKTTAEAALHSSKAAMEQMTVKSREAVEQGMKSLDEITDMARGNVEALMASARTAATGIEQIATHIADVSRKSFEEASNAARAMTSAKTPNELMQLQSDYNKGQFDAAVAEFSKLSEMMVKLAGEVMEPMQNRIALATEKMKASFTK